MCLRVCVCACAQPSIPISSRVVHLNSCHSSAQLHAPPGHGSCLRCPPALCSSCVIQRRRHPPASPKLEKERAAPPPLLQLCHALQLLPEQVFGGHGCDDQPGHQVHQLLIVPAQAQACRAPSGHRHSGSAGKGDRSPSGTIRAPSGHHQVTGTAGRQARGTGRCGVCLAGSPGPSHACPSTGAQASVAPRMAHTGTMHDTHTEAPCMTHTQRHHA